MDNRCLLVAEILGGSRLNQRIGHAEATRALERCLHRVATVAETSQGLTLMSEPDKFAASFDRCDIGIHAASEMLERVAALPPSSGVRLDLRLGVHYCGAGERNHEDNLRLVQDLAALASPGVGLITEPAIRLSTPAMRSLAGVDTAQRLNLRGLEWPVYVIGNRLPDISLPDNPTDADIPERLELYFKERQHVLDERQPVLLIGREPGNDIVVNDPRVSRQHARIERRIDGFHLVDRSTNGTYLSIDGHDEQLIHHGSQRLSGRGLIGCGAPPDDVKIAHLSFQFN